MNQPQPLCVNLVFQGFLVCQIPKDATEVELKIKTRWGKFTLHTDQIKSKPDGENSPSTLISLPEQRKYRAWMKVNWFKIPSKRRQPHNESNSHLNISTDSGTFINSGQGMGFPGKEFIDSDSDQDIPSHIPILEHYCRTYLTEKVKCPCKPMSNWSAELLDVNQPDLPKPDNIKDRDVVQDQALPSDWTDQDNRRSGKTYDKARAQSSLKPVPANPPSKGDEGSEWSEHLHPHSYRAKGPLQVSPSKPPPGWPKGIRTSPTSHQVTCSPANPKDPNNIELHITKIATISKEAFAALD